MNFILGNMADEKTDAAGKAEGWRTKADIWRDVLETMIDPTSGMDETERTNYEQKIIQKLKAGKRLTQEELDYLRIHNPAMYQTAVRVEKEREALKAKLHNCKSKEEVQQVISNQREILKAMEGDPAQEYMAAMVEKEVREFKETSEYARLPRKREKDGKAAGEELFAGKDNGLEEEGGLFQKAVVYGRMQEQCDRIGNLAQPYLSA